MIQRCNTLVARRRAWRRGLGYIAATHAGIAAVAARTADLTTGHGYAAITEK